MPFRSEAQRRFLFTKYPDLAHKWAKHYGTPKNLPYHIADKTPMRTVLRGALHKLKLDRRTETASARVATSNGKSVIIVHVKDKKTGAILRKLTLPAPTLTRKR